MRVGVGYSENPDTLSAGRQAADEALRQTGQEKPDLILLFATARHEARVLRSAVASVVGESVPIVGGGAVGAISNSRFGYAGDQVILAALCLEGVQCSVLVEAGLRESEYDTGFSLGKQLADRGVRPDDSVILLYDAVDRTGETLRLLMATPLLAGLERGLGFLPALTGAGLQGDYLCTPTPQWLGGEIGSHHAIALAFGGEVRVDSVIMHGCRPATGYYTVTKADRQTILEIDGRPALEFLDSLLGHAVPPEEYPFFLILGVNKGVKWGEFDENSYASRLCLGIDAERGGIVMFEPDMVEGTEFQIMYRSLDLDYMIPRLELAFERLEGRKPVFALYIDCAGRASGYAGFDLEDAAVVQNVVAGRAPLLGLYAGVEIAPVEGRPRGLDWTGVFCLFSVPQ